MPKKATDGRKPHEYDLGENVTVIILYPDGSKPPMLLHDDTFIVSLDRDKFERCAAGALESATGYVAPVNSAGRSGPSRVMSAEQRAEALARIGEVPAEEVVKPKPLTSEDLFREAGVNTDILATLQRAAEGG
jgi:hypothetical protein